MRYKKRTCLVRRSILLLRGCHLRVYSNIEQIVNVLSNTRLSFIVDCYYVVGLSSTQSSLGTLFVESSFVPLGIE